MGVAEYEIFNGEMSRDFFLNSLGRLFKDDRQEEAVDRPRNLIGAPGKTPVPF